MTSMEARLAELEIERELLIKQKRRNLLFAGAAISILVHLSIMLYLDSVIKPGVPGGNPQATFIDFVVVPEQKLTELQDADLEVDAPQTSLEDEMPVSDPALDANINPPAADLDIADSGAMPTLGGGTQGGEGDFSLGGGGAGTSFFGVDSHGTRFAYIVDISGSMSNSFKLRTALREMVRSIDTLPDHAYFFVLLFNNDYALPPWQKDWIRARSGNVSQLKSWLGLVTPGGGTRPYSSFAAAFGLNERPDIIFFLTDGQIPEDTPARVSALNESGGKKVIINTVAFGDARVQDSLKQLAEDSGGVYKFVPVGGG